MGVPLSERGWLAYSPFCSFKSLFYIMLEKEICIFKQKKFAFYEYITYLCGSLCKMAKIAEDVENQ